MRGSKAGLDAGLVARDVQAMLSFYVDVLGLTYVESLAIPWGTMHRLRFGESWLKLVDPALDPGGGGSDAHASIPSGSGGIDDATGIRYLTFEIDDIDDVWAALIAAGTPVYHDLGPFGSKGVVMGMVHDPDGNVVEVLFRPPGALVD